MLNRLIREPFLHFMALGGLIFAAYFWLEQEQDSDHRIVVDQQDLDHLVNLWKLQWKRDPGPGDVQALIDRYVRREVFYREALRMNLDHNDEIIKKRLAQKMEAVAIDLSALMHPVTEEQLREYFHRREDLFKLPQAYAFRQVLLLPEEKTEEQMQDLLTALRQGEEIPSARRQKLSIPNQWPLTATQELDNAFGGDFAQGLNKLPTGKWGGPIRSGYGWHLVLIERKQEPAMPDFEQVQDFVAQQYEYASGIKAQDRVYQELLAKYQVQVTAEDIPGAINVSFAEE
ncbi:peptidylprolyl isomerase [uncultured Microbulbifer sp.]|uniref:peptidylprolyl isomerase n=1 Tax=uncultured Microbulbifer sp. TaxID=348147 RepID=UPI0025F6612A|nr:peptidylprolyl isomerase [uncultured Microbulbifer sp.]